jgi:hypothetical protein
MVTERETTSEIHIKKPTRRTLSFRFPLSFFEPREVSASGVKGADDGHTNATRMTFENFVA